MIQKEGFAHPWTTVHCLKQKHHISPSPGVSKLWSAFFTANITGDINNFVQIFIF